MTIINVRDFGAKGDGITDDTTAIQAAVDHITSGMAGAARRVYLPAGTYLISQTIHLGRGEAYVSVTLEGDGPRFDADQPRQGGTAIKLQHDAVPCLNVQGGRQVYIKGMTLVGKYRGADALGYGAPGDEDINTWKMNHPCIDHVGISVDSLYGKLSSEVVVESVNIDRFYSAVSRLSFSNQNGEFIRLAHCQITRCIYGLNIGHTQARNTSVSHTNFSQVHTCICGYRAGNGTANLHGDYSNLHFGGVIQVIEGHAGWTSSLTFRDCYAESIYRIGSWGSRGAGTVLTFDGCVFYFRENTGAPPPAHHLAGTDTKVVLRGGSYSVRTLLFVWGGGATSRVVLDDCLIKADFTTAPEWRAMHGTAGIVARQATVEGSCYYGSGSIWHADSGSCNYTVVPYITDQVKTSQHPWAAQERHATPTTHVPYYTGVIVDLIDGIIPRHSISPYKPLEAGDVVMLDDAWFVVDDTADDKAYVSPISGSDSGGVIEDGPKRVEGVWLAQLEQGHRRELIAQWATEWP